MKHLKLFNLESEYTTYKNSSDFIKPNVSYVTESKRINYSANVLPTYTISTTFNVESFEINEDIKILNNTDNVKSVEIDGVKQSDIPTTAKFTTQGTHSVIYTVDTTVMNNWFEGCGNLVDFDITGMTEIGENAFAGCHLLTTITIPDTVTIIGKNAFRGCSSIGMIYSYPMVSPTIDSTTFDLFGEGPQPRRVLKKVLKAPIGSDYSSWMSNEPYYLGYQHFSSKIEYVL